MRILNNAAFENKPNAVLFDLDDTLYPYKEAHHSGIEAVTQKVCTTLGVAKKDFSDAFDKARADLKNKLGATASSHNRLLYFQKAIETLGMKTRVSLSLDLEQTYWRNFLLAARLRPSVLDFLIGLRSIGVSTAIVTDLTAQIQLRKIVFFGLESYFDYVVTSEESGSDKSGLKPFFDIQAKLGLTNADRTWMIGDDNCDVLAGKSISATTLLLEKSGTVFETQPDATFSDFGDLCRLIEPWMPKTTA